MRIAADLFLAEANARAGALAAAEGGGHPMSGGAYCHVVGLGLGVWQVAKEQVRAALGNRDNPLFPFIFPLRG